MFCLEEKKQSFEIFIKTSRSNTLLQKNAFLFGYIKRSLTERREFPS